MNVTIFYNNNIYLYIYIKFNNPKYETDYLKKFNSFYIYSIIYTTQKKIKNFFATFVKKNKKKIMCSIIRK